MIRLALFQAGAVLLGATLTAAVLQLPPASVYVGPYGDEIAARAPGERHVQNTVTAVVFDYRGLDTLGEEFLFFAAVAGCTMLLSRQREEEPDPGAAPRTRRRPGEGVRRLGLLLLPLLLVYGLSVVLHGHLSPAGGFQGGCLLAAGLTQVYVISGYREFREVFPHHLSEFAHGLGAAAYLAVGLLGLFFGARFLENVLPLGQTGHLLSSGSIVVLNLATGLEITAGFSIILYEFLENTVRPQEEES